MGRIRYVETADAKLDREGRLAAAPEDFDERKHRLPTRRDFASAEVYYEFRAGVLEARAQWMLREAESCRKRAAAIRAGTAPKAEKPRLARRLKSLKARVEDQVRRARDSRRARG